MLDLDDEQDKSLTDVERLIEHAWRQVERATNESSRSTWVMFARRLEALKERMTHSRSPTSSSAR